MAEFEADENLCLTLCPFGDRSGLDVLGIWHFDLLKHSAIGFDSLIDESRNFMTIEFRGVVEFMEALERLGDELEFVGHGLGTGGC